MFYVDFGAKPEQHTKNNGGARKNREHKNTYVVNIDGILNLSNTENTELQVVKKNGIDVPMFANTTLSVPTELVAKIVQFQRKHRRTLKYKQIATIVEYLGQGKDNNQRVALMACDGSTYPSDVAELTQAQKQMNHDTRQDFAYQLKMRQNVILMNNQIVH